MAEITYADFAKLDIRIGHVTQAEPYPEARVPAIKLWVDFGGDLGIKKSSAQLTDHYTPAMSAKATASGMSAMATVKPLNTSSR